MLRRRKADVSVLVAYLAVSFVYLGWRLVPHPGRLLIGGQTRDPEFFMWSFAWWPHAIAHALNPLSTHVIYAPTGINLTWTATSPVLAIAYSPLTLLFGPAVAYNVAALVAPALSAWTGYLLCRHLTGSIWGSVVGGYIFGFSSTIILQELLGDLQMTDVFLLPLVALAIVRYLQGEVGRRGLAWRLGVLLAVQLLISTENALTGTIVLALGLLLAFWLLPELRPRLRTAPAPIAAGYALGVLLVSPFIVYALRGIPPAGFGPVRVGADLLNVVLPTSISEIGGSTFNSIFNHLVGGAYLGLPTLLILGAFAWRRWGSAGTRLLVALFLVSFVLALGATLHVAGHDLFPLPWRLGLHAPVLENVFPWRMGVFVSLTAGVIVAFWTATTKGRIYPRPFVLPLLAVAALVPAVWPQPSSQLAALWRPERPAFFTAGLYKSCIPKNETVTIFPFGHNGDSLLYQAETNFRFRMASDNLEPVPTPERPAWSRFDEDWAVEQFNNGNDPTMTSLLAFAATHRVDRFVSLVDSGYPNAAELRSIGPTERLGDALITPACGKPPLTSRNLTAVVQTYLRQRQSQANIAYCVGTSIEDVPQGLIASGSLAGAARAHFVIGQGLTCSAPPRGYTRRGFATADLGVPADTYPLYDR